MRETDHRIAAMLDTFRRAPIERDWKDEGLRAALGSSPPLEKMKMGHTPTPWDYWREPFEGTYRIRRIIDDGENRIIIGHVFRKEHAELLVRAVNCHDELVAALEQMVVEKVDYMTINHLGNPEETHAIKVARAALAKASHGAGT